ncbi:hypothetical protein BCEN4_1130018 [Burkholderia cenocepacia]|nr:hypothetical protein BCEN4_1130018 [Burkholderia cenocepacia]
MRRGGRRCGLLVRRGRSPFGSRRRTKRAPDRDRQDSRQRRETQPAHRRTLAGQRTADQPRHDDADARPGVDHPAPFGRMQLGQASQPPLRHEHERPCADDARDETHDEPHRQQVADAHRGGQQHGRDEPEAHHPRRRDAQRRATDRADEVARVVRRREPAAALQPDRAVREHQRQQRRERETADAEHDGQADHAGERGRAGTAVGLIGRKHAGGGGQGIEAGHGGMDRRVARRPDRKSEWVHPSLTNRSRKMNN